MTPNLGCGWSALRNKAALLLRCWCCGCGVEQDVVLPTKGKLGRWGMVIPTAQQQQHLGIVELVSSGVVVATKLWWQRRANRERRSILWFV